MSVKFGATTPGGPPTAANLADNVLTNVQGLFALQKSGKYVTGARTNLKINGKLVAFAFSVSWNINLSQDEINTIDDWTPYEYAPKRITIDGSIGGFYLPGHGSPTKTLIQANALSFLFHKYITLEVRDRSTDALLFKSNKVVIVNSGAEFRSEQIGNISLKWRAIGWEDEMIPVFPTGAESKSTSKPSLPGGGEEDAAS